MIPIKLRGEKRCGARGTSIQICFAASSYSACKAGVATHLTSHSPGSEREVSRSRASCRKSVSDSWCGVVTGPWVAVSNFRLRRAVRSPSNAAPATPQNLMLKATAGRINSAAGEHHPVHQTAKPRLLARAQEQSFQQDVTPAGVDGRALSCSMENSVIPQAQCSY
jgi:hypothetical protein